MRRRRTIFASIAAIGVVVIIALVWSPENHEPLVKGSPISVWLGASRGQNVGAIAELGTNAIPFLTKALKRRDLIPYTWRVKGWRMLPKSLQTKFAPGDSCVDGSGECFICPPRFWNGSSIGTSCGHCNGPK